MTHIKLAAILTIIASAVLGTLLIAFVMWAFITGVDRQMRVDCYKWQRYAQEYPLFTLSEADRKMCLDQFGINIR